MISSWFLAARPKTLLAGFSPVAIGAALACSEGKFHLLAMASALLFAISVQIGTNFCNDYCDFFQGADTCLLYTSPSPRDKRQSRMPSSA